VSTWDVPERAAVLGVVATAVAEAGAAPPGHLPAGPPFFAYSTDSALRGLIRAAGLNQVELQTVAFTHRVTSAAALWDGVLGGTVRTAALVAGQPPDVRQRIRTAFDRIAAGYTTDDGHLKLPVSVKIVSGRR
jgi:hypothetical protein